MDAVLIVGIASRVIDVTRGDKLTSAVRGAAVPASSVGVAAGRTGRGINGAAVRISAGHVDVVTNVPRDLREREAEDGTAADLADGADGGRAEPGTAEGLNHGNLAVLFSDEARDVRPGEVAGLHAVERHVADGAEIFSVAGAAD